MDLNEFIQKEARLYSDRVNDTSEYTSEEISNIEMLAFDYGASWAFKHMGGLIDWIKNNYEFIEEIGWLEPNTAEPITTSQLIEKYINEVLTKQKGV